MPPELCHHFLALQASRRRAEGNEGLSRCCTGVLGNGSSLPVVQLSTIWKRRFFLGSFANPVCPRGGNGRNVHSCALVKCNLFSPAMCRELQFQGHQLQHTAMSCRKKYVVFMTHNTPKACTLWAIAVSHCYGAMVYTIFQNCRL